jgi:predicted metalloprotease with PDZ domain
MFWFQGVVPSHGVQIAAPIMLHVDAREAARTVFHVSERIPCAPGTLKLFYPKFIPGEHGPTGPINSVISFRITANGKPLAWRRDPVNMFEIDTVVPADAHDVQVDFDDSFSMSTMFGEIGSANLCRIKWNRLVWYPGPDPSDTTLVAPSLTVPSGWKLATGLETQNVSGDEYTFKTVSLTRLVDSPAEMGRNFKSFDVTGTSPVRHTLDIAAEGAAAIQSSPAFLKGVAHIHEEMEAISGTRHYNHYDWLLTLSDVGASDGLEHHESSEDGVFERSLVEPDYNFDLADLLCHEYFHSYNGKFRRPAGLATPNFDEPMKGELLWVYEGLTQFYGHLLACRAGLWTEEEYRDAMAWNYESMRQMGRNWRPLVDTADAAQVLYGSPDSWSRARRNTDFYIEMTLVWLEAHAMLLEATHGQKGIDDFIRTFHGGSANGPELKSYTYEDVVAAWRSLAPLDWDAFLKTRVYSIQPEPTSAGFERLGWKVVYNAKPNIACERSGLAFSGRDANPLNLTSSIGLAIKSGAISDVVPGSAADRAGLMPEAKLVSVNGRAYSNDLLKDAVAESAQGQPVEITINNRGVMQTVKLDYHGGLRYPHLERIPNVPDGLTALCKPRRK